MKKKLLVLLAALTLSLTACDSFFSSFNINGGGDTTPTGPKDLENSFINTADNEVRYVSLNKSSLTMIPGQTYQFLMAVYKQGEEPKYSGHWDQEQWGSENNAVARIDSTGLMTTTGVGSTRIFGKLFSSVGAYCSIEVIAKELESISVKNAKKTYVLGDTFTPVYTLVAHYKGDIEEVVTGATVDYSSVNTSVEGTYTVNISYSFEGVIKNTSYDVKVIDNPTYEAKSLAYTVNDLYRERTYGWYCPNTGDVKGLVIPIYFTDTGRYLSDKETSKEKVLTDLEKAFYGPAGEDGWNSVKSYYYKMSGGTLRLNGTVSSWYEPGYASGYIDSNEKINTLVKNAVNWYFTNHSEEDMRDYDSDDNGVFDSLNIIYGRPDYDAEKDASIYSLYWGKISSQSAAIVEGKGGNPDVKFHMWASFADLYNDTSHSEVDSHVYCHETGHTFGLEDYYDYVGDVRAVGGSTMMFHNTHQQDPFSTLSLGWSKAFVPETSCVIELDDYQSSHQMILLSPNPESVDSPFDEYILVELYAPNGVNEFDSKYKWKGFYSAGPSEPCVRLWHVDARLAEQTGDTFRLTDDINTPNYSVLAFSNTWGENHGTVLGRAYDDYSLLFEIRNNKDLTYKPTTDDPGCMTTDETVFHGGDTFTLADYSKQFVKGTTLNNDKTFPWKISIESIVSTESGYKATISLEDI